MKNVKRIVEISEAELRVMEEEEPSPEINHNPAPSFDAVAKEIDALASNVENAKILLSGFSSEK